MSAYARPRINLPPAELIDPHVVHVHCPAVLRTRFDVERDDDLVAAVDEAERVGGDSHTAVLRDTVEGVTAP